MNHSRRILLSLAAGTALVAAPLAGTQLAARPAQAARPVPATAPVQAAPMHAAPIAAGDSRPQPQATTTWRYVGDFSIAYNACVKAGEAGVQAGDWTAYMCVGRLIGLDVFWSLYVTP